MHVLITIAASIAALASAAGAGEMKITGCSLGCAGSAPIACAVTDVYENQQVRVEFSEPVATASLAQFSFSIVDLQNGLAAVGSTFRDPADPRTVVFNPSPVFAAGTLSFGFQAGRSYRIHVPGSDAGPGLFVRSTGGLDNTTTLDCTITASLGVLQAPTFCAGDAAAGCPCGANSGTAHGCPTSVSVAGGRLALLDQRLDGVGGGDFLWLGTELPSGCLAVLMRSTGQRVSGPVPYGDGLLCVATPVVRIKATVTSQGKTGRRMKHGVGPGTFHYQLWVRDDAMFCTPIPFNVTNGATLTW